MNVEGVACLLSVTIQVFSESPAAIYITSYPRFQQEDHVVCSRPHPHRLPEGGASVRYGSHARRCLRVSAHCSPHSFPEGQPGCLLPPFPKGKRKVTIASPCPGSSCLPMAVETQASGSGSFHCRETDISDVSQSGTVLKEHVLPRVHSVLCAWLFGYFGFLRWEREGGGRESQFSWLATLSGEHTAVQPSEGHHPQPPAPTQTLRAPSLHTLSPQTFCTSP